MIPNQVGGVFRGPLRSQVKLLIRIHKLPGACQQCRYISPVTEYQKRVDSGQLRRDPQQQATVMELDKLYSRISGYRPSSRSGGGGLLGKIFKSSSSDSDSESDLSAGSHAPQGLYLYGSVGVGKTTLMDMFYDCCDSVRKSLIKKVCLHNISVWITPLKPISIAQLINFSRHIIRFRARKGFTSMPS